MNRTDRLVALVMMLQSRRVTTAAEMAAHFEITERTVYRDIAALGESGVPILGEPGVGYSLMRGYHLPPVMFSSEEAFALITGGLFTERMTDGSMRLAIRSAVGKVTAVLPSVLQSRVNRLSKTMVVGGRSPTQGAVPLSTVQQILTEGRVLQLDYRGAARAEPTQRTVEPLGLVFYLDHWHLIAWCRLRDDVRDFRVDRIIACHSLPESIPPRRSFDLQQYLARCMRPDSGEFAIIKVASFAMESVRRFWGPTIVEEQSLGDRVQVRISFGANGFDYVARWLLGMGPDVEISSPESLRDKVVALALATADHHEAKKTSPAKTLLT
jgi:predicted DNA-binding transcriptional regulator YafY